MSCRGELKPTPWIGCNSKSEKKNNIINYYVIYVSGNKMSIKQLNSLFFLLSI
jgi:hypothetical protein